MHMRMFAEQPDKPKIAADTAVLSVHVHTLCHPHTLCTCALAFHQAHSTSLQFSNQQRTRQSASSSSSFSLRVTILRTHI